MNKGNSRNNKSKKTQKKNDVKIDTHSGSMAYNRLDMQVSQTLHMAIELFDNLDYLLVLDYYDDITLFESDANPEVVSYYQLKTKEESISINTAITNDWLTKLYTQLENPEWIVKELGLITNCPLKITVSIKDETGKTKNKTDSYVAERTSFSQFNPIALELIKKDIASKKGIKVEDVDLSKFVHMRTTLSIPKHKEIVEQEMLNFLHAKYPKMTIDSHKTIFNAMIEILTKKQSYELLLDNADYGEVRQKKGVSKKDFQRVIDEAIYISVPPFKEVEKILGLQENGLFKASYEYTKLIADSKESTESFINVFRKVRSLMKKIQMTPEINAWQYSGLVCKELLKDKPTIQYLYNEYYIRVLTTCIMINEMRKYNE